MSWSRYVSQVSLDNIQLYYVHLFWESKHLIDFYFDSDVYALLVKCLFQYPVYQISTSNNVFIGRSYPEFFLNFFVVLRTNKFPCNYIDASTYEVFTGRTRVNISFRFMYALNHRPLVSFSFYVTTYSWLYVEISVPSVHKLQEGLQVCLDTLGF